MPNKQIDNLNLLPKITRRFLEVCFEIVMNNKLNKGPYKSVRALCASIDMSEQSFFQLKTNGEGRSVTVAKIANLVHLHNVSANYLFTGKGAKFNEEQAATTQIDKLASLVTKLQKQVAEKDKKKKAVKRS